MSKHFEEAKMDDGWDDDDDLNLEDDDEVDQSPYSAAPYASQVQQEPPSQQRAINAASGWEEDDELFADDDDEDLAALNANATPGNQVPPAPQQPATDNNDGWEDDDDLNLDESWGPEQADSHEKNQNAAASSGWGIDDDFGQNEEWEENNSNPSPSPSHGTHHQPPPPPIDTAHPIPQSQPAVSQDPNNLTKDDEVFEEGWGDDDDLGLDDTWGEDDQNNHQPQPPPSANRNLPNTLEEQPQADDGWSDDLDGLDDDLEESGPQAYSYPPVSDTQSQVFGELCRYVGSLSHILSSINAVLESEYNTPEKSHELVSYYQNRPNLAEYTRTKELPRMEYAIVLPYGHIETDKESIAVEHLPDHSLISRCANQSLMADLLQVISGPDLLVRPQYLAVCVAERCKFTIHKGEQHGDMVDCRCLLNLSLPTADGNRINIGQLKVSIIFAPDQPMVEYKIVDIEALLPESEYEQLYRTVECLQMMEGHFDEVPGHEDDVHAQETPADIFRDAFIVKSSHVLAHSTEGMKMAMQDMGSVVNLQSKFRFMKNMVPTNDAMLAAEQEAIMLAQQREAHASAQGTATNTLEGDARPKSILGGMFRSGWSKLAQTVTLPDEEDLAIYGSQNNPQLYRTEPPPPNLYNNNSETQQPELYRKDESPTAKFLRPEPSPPIKFPRPEPSPVALYKRDESSPSPPVQFPRPPPDPSPLTLYMRDGESPPVGAAPSSPVTLSQRDEPEPPTLYRKDEESLIQSKVDPESPPGTIESNVEEVVHTVDVPETQEPHNQSYEEWLESQQSQDVEDQHITTIEQKDMPVEKQADENIFPSESISHGVPTNNEESYDEWLAKQASSPNDLPVNEDTGTGDGWEDSDSLLQETVANAVETAQQSKDNFPSQESKSFVLVDVPYNPETDIIETRKRWVNPRPHRPYLSNLNF